MNNGQKITVHQNSAPDRKMDITVSIAGSGGVIPKKLLTDQELESTITNFDRERAGKPFSIVRREKFGTERIYETTEDNPIEECMAEAGLEAVKSAGLSIDDICEIHLSTISPVDRLASSRSAVIERMGYETAPVMNLAHVCAGSLYALESARRAVLIKGKPVLAIAGDDFRTNVVDKSDWAQVGIFGAGAGAAVLVPADEKNYGLGPVNFWTNHKWHKLACMNKSTEKFFMNGKELGKNAPLVFETFFNIFVNSNGFDREKAFIVPHQLNGNLIESFRQRTGLRRDQVLNIVNKFGNTCNGSVLLALHHGLTRRMKRNDQVLLFGIGIGFDFAYCSFIPDRTLIQPQSVKFLLLNNDSEELAAKKENLEDCLKKLSLNNGRIKFEVYTANNAGDAIKQASQVKPDVLDFEMDIDGEANGREVAMAIHKRLGPIPTIINTSDIEPRLIEEPDMIDFMKCMEYRLKPANGEQVENIDFYRDYLLKVNVL